MKGLNLQDKYDDTALIWAARNRSAEITSFLIEAGADVNIQDGCSRTALMWAAWHNHLEVVKLLVDAILNNNKKGEQND